MAGDMEGRPAASILIAAPPCLVRAPLLRACGGHDAHRGSRLEPDARGRVDEPPVALSPRHERVLNGVARSVRTILPVALRRSGSVVMCHRSGTLK